MTRQSDINQSYRAALIKNRGAGRSFATAAGLAGFAIHGTVNQADVLDGELHTWLDQEKPHAICCAATAADRSITTAGLQRRVCRNHEGLGQRDGAIASQSDFASRRDGGE